MVLYSKNHMTHSALPAVSCVVHPPDHVVWNTSFLSSLPPQPFIPHTKRLAINIFCPQHSCYHNQGLVCTVNCVLCYDIKLLSAHCSELSGCSLYIWCVGMVLANTAVSWARESVVCKRRRLQFYCLLLLKILTEIYLGYYHTIPLCTVYACFQCAQEASMESIKLRWFLSAVRCWSSQASCQEKLTSMENNSLHVSS